MAVTRREFLLRVGQAGGYGTAFTLMQSLGLLPIPEANAQTVKPRDGRGTKVIILGGGIAGLAAAWEMGKLGYSCTLLEARKRVGGRNWTIRNGNTIDFADGIRQQCLFDEGNYFNAGPARLPSIHKTMLGYCHEFGIPLEVEVNTSRSALLQADSLNEGSAVEQRRVIYDTRGHVSELLAKCVRQGALNEEITKEDTDRMIVFLRGYGNLSEGYIYKGSPSAGYAVYPGAGPDEGSLNSPLGMHALLDADLWSGVLAEDTLDWQATMFQPIGGMDQIPKAFEARLSTVIRHEAEVTQIQHTSSGVSIDYRDGKTGRIESVEGDYCICALPLTILKSVKNNLATDIKQAIKETTYDSAYKIAWESPRFWESDFHIYGGLSYLQQTVNVVWYPSAKLFSPKGVLVGGYALENGTPFGKLPNLEAKLAASRYAVEKLHPGYSRKLTNPVYISWGQIPYNLGSWVSGFREEEGPKDYAKFTKPDGRVYFAGDHTSHLIGWQEGAALSAIRAVNMIGDRVHEEGVHAG